MKSRKNGWKSAKVKNYSKKIFLLVMPKYEGGGGISPAGGSPKGVKNKRQKERKRDRKVLLGIKCIFFKSLRVKPLLILFHAIYIFLIATLPQA